MNVSRSTRNDSWQQLYDCSGGLKHPCSIDHLTGDNEMDALKQLVLKIIQRFIEKGELNQGIKVYVDRMLRNDLIEKMALNKPCDTETLESWCERIFGDAKFGVVFNNMESYNNHLGEIMCSIVEPLIKIAGLPLGGLSFLFFMGNYGYTPFGAHKEAKGEEGFLFHLGPNEKSFYAWDNEELNQIEHNTQVFHDFETMLPHADHYLLNPGSVMFVPHQVFHIADSKEFSVSVIMDYVNPSIDELITALAQEVSSDQSRDKKSTKYLAPLQESHSLEKYVDSTLLSNRFQKKLEARVLKLKSNGGVMQPTISRKGKFMPSGHFEIIGKRMFPLIEFSDGNEDSLVLARGHEIRFKPHSARTQIIAKLNNHETISLTALRNCFEPDWELSDVYSFIYELWKIDAIVINPSEEQP